MNKEDAVIKYFQYKQIETLDYLKYGYFKRIMSYVLDNYNDYFIRKLFLKLVDKGWFYRKQNEKKSYLYKFNPIQHEPIKIKEIIDPERFIVCWD
tara:strand:- start:1644 stop:1928 length:285 start_codon:yes stop_codon:yes gene_type:complete